MLPVENIIASFCRGLQCARARRRGNRPYTFEQAVGAEFGNDSLEVTVTDAEVFRGLCEPLLERIAAAGVVYVVREAHLNGVGGVEGLVVAYVSEPFTEAACDEGEEGVVPQQLLTAAGHTESETVALPQGLHRDGRVPGIDEFKLAQDIESGGKFYDADLAVVVSAEDFDLSLDEKI